MRERVILVIGTRKGLFVAEAAKSRGKFTLRGPFGEGASAKSRLRNSRAKADFRNICARGVS